MAFILSRFASDNSGATAIEYALIAGLISISIVVGLDHIGTAADGIYTYISEQIASATNGADSGS